MIKNIPPQGGPVNDTDKTLENLKLIRNTHTAWPFAIYSNLFRKASENINRLPKALAPVVILLFIFATFGYKVLFHNQTLYSFPGAPWLDRGASIWGNDTAAKIIHQMILNSELPLWNKFLGVGNPLFSDPQNSFFSPFSFVLYFLPNTYGWDIVTLSRLFFLIYFSYQLFRYLGINFIISLCFAILYGYSGHVFYFLNILHINSLVFTPLFLLGIVSALKKDNKTALLCLSISFPLLIFGGGLLDVVLITLYGVIIILVYILERLFDRFKVEDYLPVWNLSVYIFWGLLISMVYLIPYLELRTVSLPPYSGRSVTVFNDQWYFIGLFFNKICVTPEHISNYYMKFRQYLHIVCLPGFLFSVFIIMKKKEHRPILIGSLLFLLFYYFKLYDFKFMQFINNTPLLQHVRYEKYQGTFNLAFYLLSAVGTNEIMRGRDKAKGILFIFISLFVSALPIIYRYHYNINPLINKDTLIYCSLPIVVLVLILAWTGLKADTGPFFSRGRLYYSLVFCLLIFFQIKLDVNISLPDRRGNFPESKLLNTLKKLSNDNRSRVFFFTGPGSRIPAAYGINDVRDYTALHTKRYYNFFKKYIEKHTCWHKMILCSDRPDKVDLFLAESIGVRYLVVDQSQYQMLEKNPYKNYKVIEKIDGRLIVELSCPRTLLSINDKYIVGTQNEVLRKILHNRVRKSGNKIYIEKDIKFVNDPDISLNYDISNVLWKNNVISCEISSNKDAILAVNSQYFPGWNAYVDGKQVPVFRANYLFQGIEVPKGKHFIRFRYIPMSLILGSILSILGIAFLVMNYRKLSKYSGDI